MKRDSGFTLVEVLLVVVIVAILAAAVIPTFGQMAEDSKDATLRGNLQMMRIQLELYKSQHRGMLPGENGTNAIFQLVMYTNDAGDVSPDPSPDYPLGPYLPLKLIINSFNGGFAWKQSDDPPNETPDESLKNGSGQLIGWFYNEISGKIAANAEGTTRDGIPRIKL